MLHWLEQIDWVSLAWTTVILIAANIVCGRSLYAITRPIDSARATLPDGGLRRDRND